MSRLTDQEIEKGLQDPSLKKRGWAPADTYEDPNPAGEGEVLGPDAALHPQPQN